MIATIARASGRGLLGRRRALVIALVAAIPVVVAALVRAGGETSDAVRLTADLVEALVVRAVLPLVALVLGTAVLGAQLEDGTAVYLLVKPVERWRIVAATYLVAAGLTAALTMLTTFLAGMLVGGGRGGEGLVVALTIAVGIGALLYVAVFLALSIVTGRALIVGLGYVLIWEGLLAGLLEGTQLLSIREYTLAIAQALAGDAGGSIGVPLAGSTAAFLSVVVLVVALVLATRRLEAFEVRAAD